MERPIEDLTNGNITEVKVVLATSAGDFLGVG